jgi:hypothetical protein
MKNKIIFILVFTTILLFFSCKKDDANQRIAYHKHITGEGYVFYRYNHGIIPYSNDKIFVHSSFTFTSFSGSSLIFSTNTKGFYSVRFVRSCEGYKCDTYSIVPDNNYYQGGDNFPYIILKIEDIMPFIEKANSIHPQIIKLDTMFIDMTN